MASLTAEQRQRSKQKEMYSSLESRLRVIHYKAKYSAQKRGVEFTLTYEELLGILKRQKGVCAYTGFPFTIAREGLTASSQKHPYTPSLDRIDPSLGYTKGNVAIVCWVANKMKSNMPLQLFLRVCRAVAKRRR